MAVGGGFGLRARVGGTLGRGLEGGGWCGRLGLVPCPGRLGEAKGCGWTGRSCRGRWSDVEALMVRHPGHHLSEHIAVPHAASASGGCHHGFCRSQEHTKDPCEWCRC